MSEQPARLSNRICDAFSVLSLFSVQLLNHFSMTVRGLEGINPSLGIYFSH